jgi:anti-sigma factor RsiW
MGAERSDVGRVCREVRVHLPAYVDAELARWRRRLLDLHLRRCEGCAGELSRQERVTRGLRALELASEDGGDAPPPGLLDALLEQAERPGARGRAAVPARGAVSGARPGLSAALLLTGAVAGTGAGYAAWRAACAVRHRVRGGP